MKKEEIGRRRKGGEGDKDEWEKRGDKEEGKGGEGNTEESEKGGDGEKGEGEGDKD